MIRFALERWVTVFVLSLAIFLLGVVSLSRLNIELLPDINYPLVVITTVYPGASPERVEEDVTKKIENAAALVENVKTITSTSSEGLSIVRVEFNWGTNLDFAIFDLRQKLDQLRDSLPDDSKTPSIVRQNVKSILPVAFLALTGNVEPKYLRFLADEVVSKKIEETPMVASTTVLGGAKREIQVILDPLKLYKYNISVNLVQTTIKYNNISLPTGYITLGNKDFTIRPYSEITDISELELAPIKSVGNEIIRIKDISQVVDGIKERESYALSNFKPASYIMVFKEADANTVKSVKEVRKAVDRISKFLPEGVNLKVVFGFDERIEPIIRNVQEEALYATILAIFIIFIFLLSFRSTLIAFVSIPLSILTTAVGLYFNNTSVNLISIGAVSLAIGRIVDDSIVVIESIIRNIKNNQVTNNNELKEVIIKGTIEVLPAIVASTITTLIVFVPIIFIQGLAREIFLDFSTVIVLGLLASLAVATFVVPPLFLFFYKNNFNIKHENIMDKIINRLNNFYIPILNFSLKNKLLVLSIGLGIFISSLILLAKTKKDFLPTGAFPVINVQVYNSVGGTLYDTYDKATKVIRIVYDVVKKYSKPLSVTISAGADSEAVNFVATISGASTISAIAETRVKFDSKDFFKYPKMIAEIRSKVSEIPGITINIADTFRSIAGLGQTKVIEVVFKGNDIDTLWNIANDYKREFEKIPGVADLDLSWKKGVPEFRVIIDRKKAAVYGINAIDIVNLLQVSTSGTLAGKYKEEGYEYDIRIKIPKPTTEEELLNLPVFSPVLNKNIPLRNVAQIKPDYGPVVIAHYDRIRSISIYGNKYSNYSLSEILDNMRKIIKEKGLPAGYTFEFKGEEQQRSDTFIAFFLILILGIFLIYAVLAIQFNSIMQPIILMMSIPFELIGVVIALNLAKSSLNLMSLMGILMVTGIVVSNAVLLIDYTNYLRRNYNLSKEEALVKAGMTRLKPILMTTLATIFAMIPIALGLREGGELLRPLAIAVIGGLTTSTLLTLIIVPVFYALIEDMQLKFFKSKN
ncbi:MAG: efflux RND transporter permease subunit [bacterium]|nr:efflux RND transporter permease subunit [bacterium]